MSKLSSGASYLTRDSVPARRTVSPKRSPIVSAVAAFFAMLVLFMSIQPILMNNNNGSHVAEAGSGGFVCSNDVGMGMDSRGNWEAALKIYPQPKASGRTWTLQEAFGKGMFFVNYEGEGGKDKNFIIEKPENTAKPGNYDSVFSKLEEVRAFDTCVVGGAMNAVSSVILGIANVGSIVTQMFVVFAFDSNIICEDPTNPSGVCLNLLKVIGGTTGNSDGGLIGILTTSIYLPLLVITVALTGMWVAYKGLVQRKLREALFGAIWVALSVIFGLILLLNPMLLAKAPMAVSNAVSACVIGAFNGDNCMDGNGGGGSLDQNSMASTSDKICKSSANNISLDEQMSMTVNSLSCSIWKAFVLEPYAQGSFGTSFASLDTQAATPTKAVIEKAGLDPATFCVNLGTSSSLQSYSGKTAVFDNSSGKVCNLLAYQMHLQTDTQNGTIKPPTNGTVDARWYNVIVTAANDNGLWNQWSSSFTGGLHTLGLSVLSVITTGIGSVVLIVIAFFALVYYLSAVILMAFAPLFFLLGVHPGKGKKILLGWAEKVISNVLKYLTSAIFLVVSISFYGAILGNTSNMGMTLLFVIIISGALFLYRKEIVDLIGRVNMGGEKLSNSLNDKIVEKAKGIGGVALAGAGAGLGAKLAGGKVTSGMKDGVSRELQRGGASKKIFGNVGGELLTNTTRQFNRNAVDNAQDLKQEAKTAEESYNAMGEEVASVGNEYESNVTELMTFDQELEANESHLVELENLHVQHEMIADESAREMSEDNPYFAQAQMLANQMDALRLDSKLALANGDTEKAGEIDGQIESLRVQRAGILDGISQEDLKQNYADYEALIAYKVDKSGVAKYDRSDRSTRERLLVQQFENQGNRNDIVSRVNESAERYEDADQEYEALRVKAEYLREADLNRQPGDMLTKGKVDKIMAKANAKADVIYDDTVGYTDRYERAEFLTVDQIRDRRNSNETDDQNDDRRDDRRDDDQNDDRRDDRRDDRENNDDRRDNRQDDRRNDREYNDDRRRDRDSNQDNNGNDRQNDRREDNRRDEQSPSFEAPTDRDRGRNDDQQRTVPIVIPVPPTNPPTNSPANNQNDRRNNDDDRGNGGGLPVNPISPNPTDPSGASNPTLSTSERNSERLPEEPNRGGRLPTQPSTSPRNSNQMDSPVNVNESMPPAPTYEPTVQAPQPVAEDSSRGNRIPTQPSTSPRNSTSVNQPIQEPTPTNTPTEPTRSPRTPSQPVAPPMPTESPRGSVDQPRSAQPTQPAAPNYEPTVQAPKPAAEEPSRGNRIPTQPSTPPKNNTPVNQSVQDTTPTPPVNTPPEPTRSPRTPSQPVAPPAPTESPRVSVNQPRPAQPATPTYEPTVQAPQPKAEEPNRGNRIPPEPTRSPQTPSQPVAPSTPRESPRASVNQPRSTQPTQSAPPVAEQPAQPRVPAKPTSPPKQTPESRVPNNAPAPPTSPPEQRVVTPINPATEPTKSQPIAPVRESRTPEQPSSPAGNRRTPTVPSQPERKPLSNDSANSLKLPSAPRTTRVTEDSIINIPPRPNRKPTVGGNEEPNPSIGNRGGRIPRNRPNPDNKN